MSKFNSRRARQQSRRFLKREIGRAMRTGASRTEADAIAHSKLVERESAQIEQRNAALAVNVDDRFSPEGRLRVASDKGSPFIDSVHGLFERDRLKVSGTKSRIKVRHKKARPDLTRNAVRASERRMDRNVVRKSRKRAQVRSEFSGEVLSPVFRVAGYGMPAEGILHNGTTTVMVPVDPSATCADTASPVAISADGRPKWVDVPIETWLQNSQ